MTKDSVLAILKRSPGYVSGEKISGELGVSRAAVNSAIKALRESGYDIKSVTNRGYFLANSPDKLTMGELLTVLPLERLERVTVLESVDSTNNYARELAEKGAPGGTIVIANHQTRGRGRLGRGFDSPREKGVYMSAVLRPDCTPEQAGSLTAWTAELMCDAVEAACGKRPGIKWVNDLVMEKRKISGILTEMSLEAESGRILYVVIGIGVNANEAPEDFAPEIRETAGSLAQITGGPVSRALLAGEMIRAFDIIDGEFPAGQPYYVRRYRRDSVTIGRECAIIRKGEREEVLALDIDDAFGLVVRHKSGEEETLRSGEVSVRDIDGYV